MLISARAPLLLILACIFTGCAESGSTPSRVVAVDTLPDGRIQVTNRSEGAWPKNGGWKLEEDLRLGSVAGPESEMFTLIQDLLVDPAGHIYVLEAAAQEIRVFRADGKYSHTIGRRGAGPGEFTMAMSMTWSPGGDTLWVVDPGNQRYSAFAPDGTLLTSVPRQVQQYTGRVAFMPNGQLLDWGIGFPDERPGVAAGNTVLYQPVLLARNLGSGDSLPPLEYSQLMLADGRAPQPFFGPRLAFTSDRSGRVWFVDTSNYAIYSRSIEGDTTLVFTRPAKHRPIGDEEREYVRERMARRPEMARLYLDALPTHRPVVVSILTDNAGHLFVVPDTHDAPAGSAVDVFRDTGEFLGRLPLPEGVLVDPPSRFVARVSGDNLFVVVVDDSDVPFISRSKIIRTGGRAAGKAG